jgi:hypothetical protein
MVFVTAPLTVRFALIVRVMLTELPYESDAMVVGLFSVGWLVIAPVPSCTASPLPGGVLGEPLTTVQLEAVSHAVLVPPLHRTVPCEYARVAEHAMDAMRTIARN